jgi:hypothetical protein
MQAIEVKSYMDKNGNSKLKAFCQAGQITRFEDEIRQRIRETRELDLPTFPFFNDREKLVYYIALELAKKFHCDWSENYGNMVIGQLYNGNYVFVFTGRDNANIVIK